MNKIAENIIFKIRTKVFYCIVFDKRILLTNRGFTLCMDLNIKGSQYPRDEIIFLTTSDSSSGDALCSETLSVRPRCRIT